MVRRAYGASVPVVAACTGHAVAAGALLLLGCDQRVGPDAPVKIGLNEVAIALTPAGLGDDDLQGAPLTPPPAALRGPIHAWWTGQALWKRAIWTRR